MNLLPIIARELRQQARQPLTYWLRALGLLTLLGGVLIFSEVHLLTANFGGALFNLMHLMGYCSIWLLVPLGAADCISRERREGTLGLLFLTPLRPAQIVIAKGIAHGLRAVTLVVAVIPALTIPFLIGGVVWQQAALSALINLSAVCWSLAAALVASALARRVGRALVLAMVLAGGGFLFFAWLVGALRGINSQTTWMSGYSQSAYDFFAGFATVGMYSSHGPGNFFKMQPAQMFPAVGMAAVISVAVLILAVLVAANRIRRSWQEAPPSVRVQRVQNLFCKPMVGVKFLQRWMTRKLDRNPIGWLEQRQWSGRLITWAWFAVIISVYSLVLADRSFFGNYGNIHGLIGWLLAFSLAASAAGSFRRERETGVLELLLVSPLTVRQIISGRLRGLWGQFAPAILTLLSLWIYFMLIFLGRNGVWRESWELQQIWFFAVSFLVIPVIGLYFSVRCQHYLSALLLTLAFVFVVPSGLVLIGKVLIASASWAEDYQAVAWWGNRLTAALQFLLAGFFGIRLHHKLEHRSFPLERTGA